MAFKGLRAWRDDEPPEGFFTGSATEPRVVVEPSSRAHDQYSEAYRTFVRQYPALKNAGAFSGNN